MIEVEAKVPLGGAALTRVRRLLQKCGTKEGEYRLKDVYFGNPKAYFVRLRQSGATVALHIKHKARVGRTEANRELEWRVKNPRALEKWLRASGLPPAFRKEKRSEVYRIKGLRHELNFIRGLGHYLEIEALAKNKTEAAQALKKVKKAFREFGLGEKDFERRYYMEMLSTPS